MNQIEEIRECICNFIRYHIEVSGASGVELGISGGIDSATCLSLVYEALGKEKIHCQILPMAKPNKYGEYLGCIEDAENLVTNFGVDYSVNRIDVVHQLLSNNQGWNATAKRNLMARIRMCFLYSEANTHNRLVIGTCNYSEIQTGYFTKYGDGASDIEIIGGLPKKYIYELARYWNNLEGTPKISDSILLKHPSADLYEGQTDEKELGISYENIDNYIMRDFYFDQSIPRIAEEDYQIIKKLEDQTKHKRIGPYICTIPAKLIISSN